MNNELAKWVSENINSLQGLTIEQIIEKLPKEIVWLYSNDMALQCETVDALARNRMFFVWR